MTKKATSPKKRIKDSSIRRTLAKLLSNRRKEWRFDLPLSAIVEGKLPKGKPFQEKIVLENISSGGAYFCLDSGVTVGSKLNLVIDLPKELTEGEKVKLCLGGLTVRLQEPEAKGKKQGVAICFDEDFRFFLEEKIKKSH